VSILNEGVFASIKALRSLDFRKGPFLIPFLREATKASTQRRVKEKEPFKMFKNLLYSVLGYSLELAKDNGAIK
jgi:hypothetical protein